jgi:hypothetical protein
MRHLALRLFGACMFILLACGFALAGTGAQAVHVTGGSTQNGNFFPFLFPWHYQMPINGSGWQNGENIHIILHGPMNTINVSPTNREIATLNADGSGNFNTTKQIPYDEGGAHTIPMPGLYQVVANGDVSGLATASDSISIAPATYLSDPVAIDWSHERGGRDGGVEGIKRVFPHWMSVWSEAPIGLYGTIAETDFDGNNQPSFITHSDFPMDHYAHDGNFMLIPDPDYRWAMGTSNYFRLDGDQPTREIGRMEIEGETQNAGSPNATDQGVMGMPLFATPTAGDRVYVVGRWILDAGHPDVGDRCEIHPPRLLASIRKRPTVIPLTPGSGCMTYANQVDVMVNGHGGGGNRFFHVLSDVIGAGGRVQDVMPDTTDYYSGDIFTSTGLSAEPFASNGGYDRAPEFQSINDMDYDFDVALPAPPSGALVPQVQVVKHSMDSTSVNEVITYTNPVGGLPTIAHIHLPCQGGDNGTYARTLKFAWDKYKAPGRHFDVQMDSIKVLDNDDPFGILETGEWFLWTDVCGQWINLSHLNFDSFNNTQDDDVIGGLGAAHFDVYLNPGDSMHVLTEGYEQDALDGYFGGGFGLDSAGDVAAIGVAFLDLTEPGDNDNLGGSLIRVDNADKNNTPGFYDVTSAHTDGNYYNMRVKINYVPAPPRIEMNGVPTDFGHTCLNDFQDKVIEIFNVGEAELDVNTITVTGAGFTRLGSPSVPFTIAGGEHVDITVRFSPTAITDGVGQIAFDSTDPCQGHLVFPLSGIVNYPKATLSGALSYGMLPVDNRTIGSSITKNFHVNNTGGCPLTVTGASVISAGAEFALGTLPTFPQTIQPGGSLSIPVVFNPTSQGAKSGTVQVNLGNDPTNANLTINMDGTGIVPTAVATPTDTHFKPTVVGFTKTQTVTLFNNGAAELIVDNVQMNGAAFSVSSVGLPVRLAPNTSTTFTVTFAPPSVARRFDGSLVFTTNDPNHPTVTDTFCGEGVNCGFRILVQQASGLPYAKVDSVALSSFGVHPSTKLTIKNAPLVTINPPTSCDVIQYHMERMPLPSTDQNNKKGSYYNVAVKVGNKSQNKSFTLAPSDFLEIVIKLQ